MHSFFFVSSSWWWLLLLSRAVGTASLSSMTASFTSSSSAAAIARSRLFHSSASSSHCSFASSLSRLDAASSDLSVDPLSSSAAAAATTTPTTSPQLEQQQEQRQLPAWKLLLTKYAMMAYIAGMCIALPVTLLPQLLAYKLGWISRLQKESWAVKTSSACAQWMLRLFPFCQLDVIPSGERFSKSKLPEPSIWVCNHTSMLDVFLLLAADKRLRGKYLRPIKIVYWKGLEANPISKLMFTQAGFISVDMEANGSGVDNNYDKSTFKKLLKECKQAFAEGYDIGILPEGQLNPNPERGLLPLFSGAYTLAKLSRRPIQLMALHGAHKLWSADESIGMQVSGRRVQVRCYPSFGRTYTSPEEFKATVQAVVGTFGATGRDLPRDELRGWLTGKMWESLQRQKEQEQQKQGTTKAATTKPPPTTTKTF